MELPKCCVIQHCFTSAYIQIRIYMRIYSYQISPKGTHGIFWGSVLLAVIVTRDSGLGIQQNLCCYGLSFPCTNYFLPPWKRGRMAIELGSPLPPVPFWVAQCGCLTDRLQVDVLSAEALLSPQHGVVEGFKVLGGIGVAEEPIESCPDEQRAEKRPLRVVGFRKEQLLCPGESLGIELLQGRVGGDQRILQSPGPEAELLRVFALQHCGEAHGPLGTWQSSALRAGYPGLPAVGSEWEPAGCAQRRPGVLKCM